MTLGRLQDDSESTQTTQGALREYLICTQRAFREKEQLDFVIPSEPKILCLVIFTQVPFGMKHLLITQSSSQTF